MILDRLKAKNFGRYRSLELTSLPERGLIGVVGPNESGKTTIGEVICFALFGRTAVDRAPEEHIHWKEDEMSLEIEFRDPDEVPWRIVREIDRSGTYSASLLRLDDDKAELIKGVGKVQAQVEKALRLDFEEFTYAFFLGQKELDISKQLAIDTKKHLVDELTGVGTIERATDQVSEELDGLIGEKVSLDEELRLATCLLEEYQGRRQDESDPTEEITALESQEAEMANKVQEHEKTLNHAEAYSNSADKLRNYLYSLKAKAYSYILAKRRHWLDGVEGKLSKQLKERETDLASLDETGKRRELFKTKLKELASVVAVRHNQIKRALENKLPAEIAPGDEDVVTPDGKIEQLVVTRLRSNRATEEAQKLESERNRFLTAFIVTAILTYVCHAVDERVLFSIVTTKMIYWFFLAFSAILFTYGGLFASRAKEQHVKVDKLRDTSQKLERDVSKLREASRLCDEFNTDRLDDLQERLEKIGGGILSEYYRELKDEYEEFLEGRTDYLRSERGAEKLTEQISELHDDLVEVRHVKVDLENWLSRFSNNPFFKLPSVESTGTLPAYERGAFQQSCKQLNREVEGCQKALFILETECRSPVSSRICSSFRDFTEVLDELAELTKREHKLYLEQLQLIQKGDMDSLEDPIDIVAKQEQRLGAFCPSEDKAIGNPDEVRALLAADREELGQIRLKLADAQQRLARLEPDALRCKQLEEEIEGKKTRYTEVNRAIRVREILLELLTGLSERMRERLAPALADYIRCVLPPITGFRYREVQLTEDLDIQVYSPEKGDYVHLEDLSGGTVDQLLVSMRLAFAKALMDAKMPLEPHQFLFFDEPLSSFDRGRAEAFLNLLRTFGGTFAQVFLVSHLGGLKELFDAVILTHLDKDNLSVTLMEKPPIEAIEG